MPLLPHAAVRPPMATMASAPAAAPARRRRICESTLLSLSALIGYEPCRCTPGGSVGAGGASTLGVNRLPPFGSIDFSVGATVADEVAGVVVDVVVVVVVVVLEGASLPFDPHAAVRPPNAISAAHPAVRPIRRTTTREAITSVLSEGSHTRCDNEPPTIVTYTSRLRSAATFTESLLWDN